MIEKNMLLSDLNHSQVHWLQTQLVRGGYLDKADGVMGPRTREAFREWKEDAFLSDPEMIGPGSARALEQLQPPENEKPEPPAPSDTRRARLPILGVVTSNTLIDYRYPFTWGELTHNLTRVPDKPELVKNAQKLIQAIGPTRLDYGKPWRVTSGYRPPSVNQSVGGATRSTHLFLRAMDIIPDGLEWKRLIYLARKNPAIKGIGLAHTRRGFLHLDIGWKDTDPKREFPY